MDEDEGSDLEDVVEAPVVASSSSQISGKQPAPGQAVGEWFVQRAAFIPLRLTLSERKFLRLLEAALQVSEYTDRIDTIVYGSKVKRIVAQIKELCAILSGLVLAADYKQVRAAPLVGSLFPTPILYTIFRVKSFSRIVTLSPTQNSTKRSSSLVVVTRL